MSKFRTLGPAVHGTPTGYSVCPLLEVTDEPPAPLTTRLVTFLVLDPEFQIVFTGPQGACIANADAHDPVPTAPGPGGR